MEAREKAASFFDSLWSKGDPWELETSAYEDARYAALLAVIADRRYARALEIGCGAGTFARRLAPYCGELVALDVSQRAIDRARASPESPPTVRYVVGDALKFKEAAKAPWDLIVLSETVYYLGWLYPFFDVAWFASELRASTAPGGRLLLANTRGGTDDYLILSFIVDTYRDLFVNAGFELELERLFHGRKKGADLEVSINVLTARVPI